MNVLLYWHSAGTRRRDQYLLSCPFLRCLLAQGGWEFVALLIVSSIIVVASARGRSASDGTSEFDVVVISADEWVETTSNLCHQCCFGATLRIMLQKARGCGDSSRTEHDLLGPCDEGGTRGMCVVYRYAFVDSRGIHTGHESLAVLVTYFCDVYIRRECITTQE